MMPPIKRRRVDSTSALNKPFRSPLSRASKQADDAHGTAAIKNLDSSTGLPQNPDPARPSLPARSPRPSHARQAAGSLLSPTRPIHDAAYIALQKRHSQLALDLKHIASSLDTTTQAIKILNSSTDTDLHRLVQKWRTASRDAAEELFSVAKDRVNRMGGVSAWRERYQRNADPFSSTGTNDADFDEDELTPDQREQLEIVREDARREAEKYGLLETEDKTAPAEKDDDSFTIDMMLKQLNVDLDVIGYDVQVQRWT